MERLVRLPPGFRFHPTDEELVVQYLKRKALSWPLPAAVIPEIDLGNYDPWDLPGCNEGERYFFNLQESKYRKGNRSKRATRSGYWKAKGKDRPVHSTKCNELVGMKKVLVFHQGKPPYGVQTHWTMHEYRLASPQNLASNIFPNRKSSSLGKDWVVCRIFMKKTARNDNIGFMEMMNNGNDHGPKSPPTSSCITDLSDEECSKGEEASSKWNNFEM